MCLFVLFLAAAPALTNAVARDLDGCETKVAAVTAAVGRRPVFVNYDDTHFMHSRDRFGLKVDEAEIRSLVRQYEGTDVSDLVFCIGGRIADVPNKAKESWLDKYRQTNENGIAVCYDVPAYPEENALVEIVAEKALTVSHLDLQVRCRRLTHTPAAVSR